MTSSVALGLPSNHNLPQSHALGRYSTKLSQDSSFNHCRRSPCKEYGSKLTARRAGSLRKVPAVVFNGRILLGWRGESRPIRVIHHIQGLSRLKSRTDKSEYAQKKWLPED